MDKATNRLEGKVALITGATKGIGEATARLFAKEGSYVLICGRDSAAGEKIESDINREYQGNKMVPINRTLEKKCLVYRYFLFIILIYILEEKT